VSRDLVELEAGLGSVVLVVEQAELHALGALGEEGEVRALPVPRRTERERPARPDLQRSTAPERAGSRTPRPSSSALAVLSAISRPSTGTVTGPSAKLQAISSGPRRNRSHGPSGSSEWCTPVDPGARELRSQPEQLGMERRRSLVTLPGQLGREEGRFGLRIGHLLPRELGEGGELPAAALPGRGGDVLVDVVGEELERRPLAVLVAHEDHRGER
jgi:hypothetical protein